MATINDDPVTRFTTAQIIPTEADIQLGQFFGVPQLTQAQIDEIPMESLVQGMIVFNTDYDCYMGFVQGSIPDTPGRWCNFNASITYNGSGYEAGSPFALPLGPRSVVESTPNNMDPGVMYVDSENNELPRIYIPATGWQDVATSGTNPTFGNVTIDGNLTVEGITTSNGGVASTRYIGFGSPPTFTLTSNTAIVGVGATSQIYGTEFAGIIFITTGTGITTGGKVGTVTLATPMPTAPIGMVAGYQASFTLLTRFTPPSTYDPSNMDLLTSIGSGTLGENSNYYMSYLITGF